ncbi:hypothetical protein SteCoe_2542 [Stentor coeruleus]|uniref:Acyl-coenzyme A oxidase n=1 Tax=Stentor coeruleus TaxID=5963 RepID=A0A1R2CIM2_9CILI|nr:hypothetical protein SteCoe_9083 [Stentor coeruleus]OMJ94340.1 hypothetical protein SteCoe_2542 [Stentor coeruleus]
MSAIRRLLLIENHLSSQFPNAPQEKGLDDFRKLESKVNHNVLAKHYFDDFYEANLYTRKIIDESPLFTHQESLGSSVEDYRGKVVEQLKCIYSKFRMSYEKDLNDPIYKCGPIYGMAEYDQSLSTRMIVHIILYTDTIQNLGTGKHRELIDRAYALKDYGSFGMTELGHGSDVGRLETTATYNPKTGGFTLNSPTATSAKWWIGAIANTANMSVIFARLIVDNADKGIQVFAVPIRDYETHDTLPGVVLGDCGKKISHDGIDNGFILFKNYEIGYDCLLDKFSQIKNGKFKSTIKNKEKRLGIMMAGLIRGRFCAVSGSEINTRSCLTIAIRYGALRKQFGNPKEESILLYQTHNCRLVTGLSKAVAMRCASKVISNMYKAVKPISDLNPECDELNEFHSVLSSLKCVCAWYGIAVSQECREACGGHGVSEYSSLGRHRGYVDVHATWEGDNAVLGQQTGKYILKILQKSFKGQKFTSPTLSFLKIDFQEVKSFKSLFTSREEFENEKCIIALLEHRVNFLTHTSVIKLQESSMAYSDMTTAWNNSQVFYIQDLSKSFAELIMAREFIKLSDNIYKDCKETGMIIKKLFYLYSADRILNSISLYLESAITHVQEKIIRDTFIKLASELAPASLQIVDALAASDKILGSVIGSSDGQAYSRMINAVESEPKCYYKPKWLHLIKDIRGS